MCDHDGHAVDVEISDGLAARPSVIFSLSSVPDDTTHRNTQYEIAASRAVTLPGGAGPTTLSASHSSVAIRTQRGEPTVRDHHHVPSPPAVTTVRSTLRHKLLSSKRDSAITAIPGDDHNLN